MARVVSQVIKFDISLEEDMLALGGRLARLLDGQGVLHISGDLGAGKTTTLARLAQHYMSQGKNVGIVTNDQADDLVDTTMLRSLGFDVGEVAGACFCCNFDELMSTVRSSA